MRLKSFRVTNFQSVLDSGPVETKEITCLVGKNEAGKSAILKALYRLNPIRKEDGTYSVTDDYPRMDVTDYEAKVKKDPAAHEQVVRATYELDDDDIGIIYSTFGDKCLRSREVSTTKNYANIVRYHLKTNEAEAQKYLIRNLPEELKELAGPAIAPSALLKVLEPHAAEPNVTPVIDILKSIATAITDEYSYYIWNTLLDAREPKYLYFDEYYQMRGCETER